MLPGPILIFAFRVVQLFLNGQVLFILATKNFCASCCFLFFLPFVLRNYHLLAYLDAREREKEREREREREEVLFATLLVDLTHTRAGHF